MYLLQLTKKYHKRKGLEAGAGGWGLERRSHSYECPCYKLIQKTLHLFITFLPCLSLRLCIILCAFALFFAPLRYSLRLCVKKNTSACRQKKARCKRSGL